MARYYCIHRDNKPDTKNIVVCEKCWSENYPIKLDNERARNGPSVFLHALNKAKFQNYYHKKEVPLKHWQKQGISYLMRATIFLIKQKIFRIFQLR